jgi:hypothetical protein
MSGIKAPRDPSNIQLVGHLSAVGSLVLSITLMKRLHGVHVTVDRLRAKKIVQCRISWGNELVHNTTSFHLANVKCYLLFFGRCPTGYRKECKIRELNRRRTKLVFL